MPVADPEDSSARPDAMDGEPTLPQRYEALKARVLAAQQSAASPPVRLLAVSKTKPATAVLALHALGHQEFGENYVQEALDKRDEVLRAGVHVSWHLIGPLQSNKTRAVAQAFDWVQSVDRLKIAQRLSEQRPAELEPLQVCVQVNISDEPSKAGCSPDQAVELCRAVSDLPRLRLRGLMAIPVAPTNDPEGDQVAIQMRSLKILFDRVQNQLKPESRSAFDTLSMGMSQDLELAIRSGANLVRVGTALFGTR